MKFNITHHAMEQFQNRTWLKDGSFIPWKQLQEKITELLEVSEVFPTNETGIVEYHAENWVFVVGQGEKSKNGLPCVITTKLRFKSGHIWNCPRRTDAVPVYLKNEGDLVAHLQWGGLDSKKIFEFTHPVSVREILYALRSFGCKMAPEREWSETNIADWVAIPVFLPHHPIGIEVVRKVDEESAVVPTKKKFGKNPMVVSEMEGQYWPLHRFIDNILSRSAR